MTASTNVRPDPAANSNTAALDGAAELERLADLLAVDEIRWPSGLTTKQADELATAVRRHRRSRLRRIIAQQIARDLRVDLREE